eukprot:11121934-Heterocapsa_arctica.AAC.1
MRGTSNRGRTVAGVEQPHVSSGSPWDSHNSMTFKGPQFNQIHLHPVWIRKPTVIVEKGNVIWIGRILAPPNIRP